MPDIRQESFTGNLIRFWGRNTSVGTTMADLNTYAIAIDPYTVMGAGAALDVTSSSTADAAAGTGARTVRIVGLDANYAYQTDVVTMNGQTIVTTASIWTDVWGADVITHGSGNTNAGDIYMVKTGTGGTYTAGVPGTVTSGMIKILAGFNTDVTGHFMVPKTGNMSTYKYRVADICASSYTQAAALLINIQDPTGTDKSLHIASIIGLGSSGHAQIDAQNCALTLSSGQALRLRALGAAASAVVQATVTLERVF
jgi:hypothetical protein